MSERYLIVLFDKRSVFISKEQAEVIKQALKQGAQFVEVKGNLYKASAIAGIEKQKSGVRNESDKLFLPLPEENPVRKETVEKIKQLKQRFSDSIGKFQELSNFEKGQVHADEERDQVICSEEGWYLNPEGEKIYT